MSMTCGQCDARSTVTFPTARHYWQFASTKLYCLVAEARVLTCQGIALDSREARIQACDLLIASPAT